MEVIGEEIKIVFNAVVALVPYIIPLGIVVGVLFIAIEVKRFVVAF